MNAKPMPTIPAYTMPSRHDAVEDAVQFGAPVEEQQEDEHALRGLLGERRHQDRLRRFGGAERERVERLQEQSRTGRDERAPAQAHQEQGPRFRLVPVEPEVRADQRGDRERRQDDSDRDRLRGAGGEQDQGHHARAREQQHAHPGGERDVVALGMHAASVVGGQAPEGPDRRAGRPVCRRTVAGWRRA
jgi:hypothetical protein